MGAIVTAGRVKFVSEELKPLPRLDIEIVDGRQAFWICCYRFEGCQDYNVIRGGLPSFCPQDSRAALEIEAGLPLQDTDPNKISLSRKSPVIAGCAFLKLAGGQVLNDVGRRSCGQGSSTILRQGLATADSSRK